jgi:hypothetical protein
MKKFSMAFVFLFVAFISHNAEAAYAVKSTPDVQNFFNVAIYPTATTSASSANEMKLRETVKALEFHLNRIKAEADAAVVVVKDTVPPAITFVNASSSASSTIIVWTTNELSDSRVLYGTSTGSYSGNQYVATNVMSHVVSLAVAFPGAKYYYVVESKDASGNVSRSKEYTFTIPMSAPKPNKVSLGNFFQNYFHNVKAQVVYMFGK